MTVDATDFFKDFTKDFIESCRREKEIKDSTTVAVDNQPAPLQEPVGVDIGELVINDLRERIEYGRGKYGVSLHSHDGRDTLVDAFQEALDLALYLRKAIVERDSSLR